MAFIHSCYTIYLWKLWHDFNDWQVRPYAYAGKYFYWWLSNTHFNVRICVLQMESHAKWDPGVKWGQVELHRQLLLSDVWTDRPWKTVCGHAMNGSDRTPHTGAITAATSQASGNKGNIVTWFLCRFELVSLSWIILLMIIIMTFNMALGQLY